MKRTLLRLVVVLLIAPVLVFGLAPVAPCKIISGEFGEAVANLYGVITKQYLFLCVACVSYYGKEGRWPANEKELANSAAVKKPRPGTDDELVKDMFKTMDVEFIPLPDGSIIMKARFDKKLEDRLVSGGFGKCMLELRVKKTDKKITFTPTAGTKDDKDYFPLNVTMPIKEGAAEEEEPIPTNYA